MLYQITVVYWRTYKLSHTSPIQHFGAYHNQHIAQRERLKAEREAARNERVSDVSQDESEIGETPDDEQSTAVNENEGISERLTEEYQEAEELAM